MFLNCTAVEDSLVSLLSLFQYLRVFGKND